MSGNAPVDKKINSTLRVSAKEFKPLHVSQDVNDAQSIQDTFVEAPANASPLSAHAIHNETFISETINNNDVWFD